MIVTNKYIPYNRPDFGHKASKHDAYDDHDGVEAHDVEPTRPQAPEYRVQNSDPEDMLS